MTNINVVVESKKVSGLSFLLLALCAFAGIATEMIHVLFTMPVIFGASGDDWTTAQSIIHWIITCITWGFITFVLVRVADRKFQFTLPENLDGKYLMSLDAWGFNLSMPNVRIGMTHSVFT